MCDSIRFLIVFSVVWMLFSMKWTSLLKYVFFEYTFINTTNGLNLTLRLFSRSFS
jgi:hypothetical protein